ncbi:hypothetical protein [[Eubacterium] cellulosolvens]
MHVSLIRQVLLDLKENWSAVNIVLPKKKKKAKKAKKTARKARKKRRVSVSW